MPDPKRLTPLSIRKKLLLLMLFIFLNAGVVIISFGLAERQELIAKAEKDTLLLVENLAAQ